MTVTITHDHPPRDTAVPDLEEQRVEAFARRLSGAYVDSMLVLMIDLASRTGPFASVMDGVSRGVFDQQLVHGVVPQAEGLTDALADGIRVADIGCGTGHSSVVLARAFPASPAGCCPTPGSSMSPPTTCPTTP